MNGERVCILRVKLNTCLRGTKLNTAVTKQLEADGAVENFSRATSILRNALQVAMVAI